jgi:hypothetical protein
VSGGPVAVEVLLVPLPYRPVSAGDEDGRASPRWPPIDLIDDVEGIINASDFIEKPDGAQLLFI